MRRRTLGLLCALLLTGCTTGAVAPLRAAAPGSAAGGTLRLAITTPGSIDPGNDYEPMGDLVLRAMCDPLIAVDPVSGALRPGLVRSWVVSDSGQRLVLRLRKGLRFSDGSPLTADDVAFTLSRIASADYASAAADQLRLIDGYAQVHGDAATDSDLDRRQLRGVKAIDAESVEISLSERQGDFLRLLTSRLVSPVPRKAASTDGAAFARQPVCSGPYRLDRPYAPGDQVLRLSRVAGYTGTDTTVSAGGRGYPDALEFHVYPDARAAAAAQRRGDVEVAAAEPGDRRDVQSGPGPQVEFVGLPTATEPVFTLPAVRRALALALDRQALVTDLFPTTRSPATGFLPPTTRPVFRPGACGAALPAEGDVAGARRALAAAGVDLRQVQATLSVNADGANLALSRAVAAQWRTAVGLTVRVVPMTFEAFVARGTAAKGFDGPFRFSWATPYPDPYGSLYPLFASDRIGRDNFSRFSSSAVDTTLVRRAAEAVDPADRQLELRRVEDLLCQAMPMIPLTFSTARFLVSPKVRSAAATFVDGSSGQFLVREAFLQPPSGQREFGSGLG